MTVISVSNLLKSRCWSSYCRSRVQMLPEKKGNLWPEYLIPPFGTILMDSMQFRELVLLQSLWIC